MPKERRGRSLSFDRWRTSPYPCSSSHSRWPSSIDFSGSAEDLKEWEEARCPICMEHPHNAVLLVCSSHDKGCRPYMCDTSYRHSNCLDQFYKAFTESPVAQTLQGSPASSNATRTTGQEDTVSHQENEEPALPPPLHCVVQEQRKLLCPLCRGQIKDWIVVESARQFMNAKVRSCANESCTYSGTYSEIRKHARCEHPLVRPAEADPERQRDWRRLERQRDLGDVLSTFQSVFDDDRVEDDLFSFDEGNLLTVFFLVRVLPQGSRISWSVPPGFRGSSRGRRRASLWGEMHESEPSTSVRGDDEESEGASGIQHHHDQNQRRTTPDNEP